MSPKNESNKNTGDQDSDCTTNNLIKEKCPKFVSHPLRFYQFSDEEIKALEECDRESFYNRCLPLEIVFGSLTYGAVRCGLLKRNPVFGVFPKLTVAILLGHAIGRASAVLPLYEPRLMKLSEKSQLGKLVRDYYKARHTPPEDSETNKSVDLKGKITIDPKTNKPV